MFSKFTNRLGSIQMIERKILKLKDTTSTYQLMVDVL